MNFRLATIVLSLLILFRPCGFADTDQEALLVGKWSLKADANGTQVDVTTVYRKDYTFKGEGTIEVDGETFEVGAEGTWKIEDGKLYFKVTKSKNGSAPPDGEEAVDIILELTETTFRYENPGGIEFTAKRVVGAKKAAPEKEEGRQ